MTILMWLLLCLLEGSCGECSSPGVSTGVTVVRRRWVLVGKKRRVELALTGENVSLHCDRSLPQCLKGAGTPFDPTRYCRDPDIVRCLCHVSCNYRATVTSLAALMYSLITDFAKHMGVELLIQRGRGGGRQLFILMIEIDPFSFEVLRGDRRVSVDTKTVSPSQYFFFWTRKEFQIRVTCGLNFTFFCRGRIRHISWVRMFQSVMNHSQQTLHRHRTRSWCILNITYCYRTKWPL